MSDVSMQPEVVRAAGEAIGATEGAAQIARGALGECAFGPSSVPSPISSAAGKYRAATSAAGAMMTNCGNSSAALGAKFCEAANLIACVDGANASGMGSA